MNRRWPNMLQPSLEIWPSLLSWHSFPCSRMTLTHYDSSRQQPHLHPRRSFLMPEDWVQIYFNQKDINIILLTTSHLPILEPECWNPLSPVTQFPLQFSPPPLSLTFYEPPPLSFTSLCDKHIFSTQSNSLQRKKLHWLSIILRLGWNPKNSD